MSKAEVVEKTTTATIPSTATSASQFTSELNEPTSQVVYVPITIESELNQPSFKSKSAKVLFDLDKKQETCTETNSTTTNNNNNNNNINNNTRRLSNVSQVSITKRSNNSKEFFRSKSGGQVELNMDSIVVAKTATSSNNSNIPINNRLRNIIEIFRNTFNTSSGSSSKQKSSKQQTKQKAIQNTLSVASGNSTNQKQNTNHNNNNNNINNYSDSKTKHASCKKSSCNQIEEEDEEQSTVCQLCFNICSMRNKHDGSNYMYDLDTCDHSFCIDCLRLYLKYQIIESRVSISCPQCSEKMHPNDIYRLLSLTNLITSMDTIQSNYFNTITGNASASPISVTSSSSISSSETPSKKLLPNSVSEDAGGINIQDLVKKQSSIDSNQLSVLNSINKQITPTISPKPPNLQEQQQNWPTLIQKYEEFMLRRVLVAIPDTRWCPAPDCTYAVIASGCANCPQLFCMRPDCNTSFCYHCKQYWHPNLTCEDAAMRNNQSPIGMLINMDQNGQANAASTNKLIRSILQRSNSHISTSSNNTNTTNNVTSTTVRIGSDLLKEEIKRCPKCQALIVKMDDGSCNHITCAVCGCEFCWLCMKEISDLHYLSPSGCTFWGKKPWSRKKKILWQLGILIGAPVGIALIAGVAVPAILIGLPIWSGRKVYVRYKTFGKHKRNLIVMGTVMGTVLVAPLVAALAVGIGVPILLAYVYGVVPISLCRSGGCGVTTNNNGGVRFAFDDEMTDNLNFFTYNNTINANGNEVTTNSNGNQTPTQSNKNSSTKPSSVKIPISAIESKPDNILMVRSSPPYSANSAVDLNGNEVLRPQTPVLVTITVAKSNTNPSKLKNSINSTSLSSTAASKTKQNSSRVKRIKSASSTTTSTNPTKESNNDKKKSKFKASLSNKNVTSIAATTCGSVELLKLNKTSNDFNYYGHDHNSGSKHKDTKMKSIAAELINETAPMSSITINRSKLNNTTNTSDNFDNNLSSSSSHHLIDSCSKTDEKHDEKENNVNLVKTKFGRHKQKMNPSIGEMSIGAYTNTSLSADIMDVDDDDDNDDEDEEVDDEHNNVNKKYEDEDDASNFQYDQENCSTKAIASGSIKKYSIESNKQPENSISIIRNELFSDRKKSMKIDSKSNYERPVDTYSVSIVSEKSINPSVTALAGSLKDNQSVDNLSATDDRVSIKLTGLQTKLTA